MQWFNEPATWSENGDVIRVTAAGGTDFWRKTHYGFIRDNGHFFYQEVNGDFECSVQVRGRYATLYDQAGLMVRKDETTWLKTGIEFVEGVQYASAVVTHDFSDWSVATLPGQPAAIWLRLTRVAEAIEIAFSLDGTNFTMLRHTYLGTEPRLQVGVMCAAPQGSGFDVEFEGFRVEVP